MHSLNTMREQRASKVAEMRSLSEAAQSANRDLDTSERTRFDTLESEVRGLSTRITDAEKLAEFERLEERGEQVSGPIGRELRGYSVAKALTEGMNGRLSGLEAEMHRELSRDRSETRGVMVPTEVLFERRDLSTTTPADGPGSNLIATQLGSLTDRRRAALKVESMGATVLRGLTGNLDLPRLTESGSAGFVAERADATRSDVKFAKVGMTPKTVSAEYAISRRMMLQSQTALEPLLRADLGYLLSQRLDAAAIMGGGANEPVGILADADVASLTAASLSSDLTADLIAALELDDVTGTTAFLTHTSVLAQARKIKDGDGHVIPLAELFHNQRVEASTQVPATSPDPLAYPLIYGEWASLYVGYWSGVDILVNPYHADVASNGGALLHAFLDADVVVRHKEGFRWAEVN
ncbi:phage major capsid protein [Oceanicella sp. SM1341]|uniref:phage major capsid protein n=1 Tax=Oceanicella sp. SM1341 TaxID=1548889 RepID=UPI0013007085|nr:phage major capsid protein [Oceanicella sp. SM1341]